MAQVEYKDTKYFHAAHAADFQGKDYVLYRFFEIIPGLLAWGTLIGAAVLSFFIPLWVAYFIIAFDLYWLLKNAYLSIHLRHNWKRLKHNMKVDWKGMLSNLKYEHLHHMILLPFYKESEEVVSHSIDALLKTNYNKKKMIVVLAGEESAGDHAQTIIQEMQKRYGSRFEHFIGTLHPKGLPGEIPGKGSNISFAAEESRKRVLDAQQIPYKDVIVSAFDIDTVAYPAYFNCLTWNFLTAEHPYKSSFQPVPLYNNNIWQAPAISRVVATSSTFWQMIQQERPEKLATFSSHAVAFTTLYEANYWQRNMVSEDSRIYWNLFLAHNGDYRVVPLSYPVSMDANLAPTFFQTFKNIYKQHRRWMWGVENIPYILMGCVKNKRIPLRKKIKAVTTQLEGFWSLSTNPLIIFLLGWLPLALGGHDFNSTLLARNLPIITRDLMMITMVGLILLAAISQSLLPPRPSNVKASKGVTVLLQWILVPFTITLFGAIPGLDAQTRLMLGKYLGFWVTPKHRG
ncbi:MAG TPA: glycosyltransferase family 2 protein [Candidatus Paceibacterota bacterium]|nr:glycosyltransferase family 2 protein [Candidatus Paceibacterota bacterium]